VLRGRLSSGTDGDGAVRMTTALHGRFGSTLNGSGPPGEVKFDWELGQWRQHASWCSGNGDWGILPLSRVGLTLGESPMTHASVMGREACSQTDPKTLIFAL
jgi:hypothetical protein